MTKKSAEQSQFLHGKDMSLEYLARSIGGEKHFGSVNYSNFTYWKKFYVSALEVIDASIFRSIGSIDDKHRSDIQKVLDTTIKRVKELRSKDEVHSTLIVGLFKLVFLLLGRAPYHARGKVRNLSAYRTLSYCQTEEQLSWLLQSYLQRNAVDLGYKDSFQIDYAFFEWTKERKMQHSDRSNYVTWVREKFPNVLVKFK